jgi:hypothetical protein
LANRLPGPEHQAALARFPENLPANPEKTPLMILGHQPVWQPLIPAPGGRWQAHALAFDPATASFRSTWGEQGIGCIQCHGTPAAGHGQPPEPAP